VPADVVNLGYVVNVIEDPSERAEALTRAWSFSLKTLIVSARLNREAENLRCGEFGDGYLTRLGTFQKFYDQSELREWIESVLEVAPVAAAPGIFYVFRTEEQKHAFVSSRYQRRLSVPEQRLTDILFERHREILQSLMDFFAKRGRLPADGELDCSGDIVRELGSLKRAFGIVRRATGAQQWNGIVRERKSDLLVYLALAMFPKPPRFTELPETLRYDVRALFSTHKRACIEAKDLLFSVGNFKRINEVCSGLSFGKLLPDALYVHVSAIDGLPPELRVYEGCARVLAGRVDGATVVKFSRREPKVTYLHYPNFDEDPHPALEGSLRVHLQTFSLKYRDFSNEANPPILHRKETLVATDYPLREEFSRLTRREEGLGLLAEPLTIGRRDQWLQLVHGKGLRFQGHNVAPMVRD
jgi:DNA phosphorothioation-associated putative methyltransferase